MSAPNILQAGPDGDLDLRRARHMLFRNVPLIVLCTASVVAAVAIYTFSVAPVFEATGSIRIEEGRSTLPALDVLRGLSVAREVSTEMEVLRSRALADHAVRDLGLQLRLVEPRGTARHAVLRDILVSEDAGAATYVVRRQPNGLFAVDGDSGIVQGDVSVGGRVSLGEAAFTIAPAVAAHPELRLTVDPHERAIERLGRTIRVARPSREANIVTVRYRDTDPQLASDVINVLMARFIALRQDTQKAEVQSTVAFLTGQIGTIRGQLGEAEIALRRFREAERIIDLPAEASTGVSHLAALRAERTTLDAERQALAALFAEVDAASTGGLDTSASAYRRLIAYPTLLRNQAAAEMLRSLAIAEDQRAELRKRRQGEDPDLRVLDARVDELETQLRSITTTYLQGLTNQVAALDASIAQSGQRLDRIPARELEFARLQRDATVLEELYTLMQTRLREAQILASVDDRNVRIVDQAVPPAEPVTPTPALNLVAGAIVGLLLGVTATFAREYTNRRVRSRRDLQMAAGVPVLGLIPRIRLSSREQRRLLSGNPIRAQLDGERPPAGSSAVGTTASTRVQRIPTRGNPVMAFTTAIDAPHVIHEAYSRLLLSIRFARPDETTTLLITSPLPDDGKTTTALNLALTTAQQGRRTLLIDADMRRGTLHAAFGDRREPGLSDVLTGAASLDEALRHRQAFDASALDYMAAGTPVPHPSSLVGGERMSTLLRQLQTRYDMVILDSPPVNLVTDAAVLANHVDGVILVARARTTKPEALGFAMEQLHGSGALVLGTVLNDIDLRRDAAEDTAYQWQLDSYEYVAVKQ